MPSDFEYVLLGVSIFGIVTNVLFAVSTVLRPLKSRVSNFFITSQCLVDAGASLIYQVIAMWPPYHHTGLPVVDVFMCHIFLRYFFYWVLVMVSAQTLVCIAIERYIAVFHPVKYIQYSRTIIIAGQVMSYAVGFAVNMGQPFQRLIVNETCRYDITSFPEWYLPIYLKCYALSYFFVQFIFPTIVFLYVYTKLVVFFHRRFKSSDSENKSRKILTYSSIAMTFQFVLLFSFDTVNYILTVFDITEPYEYGTFKQQFGVFCITLSSSVNPAILMVTMPQRRRIFWQLFVPAAVRHRVHAAGPNSVTNTEDTVT